jgi:hypothetical protein
MNLSSPSAATGLRMGRRLEDQVECGWLWDVHLLQVEAG